MRYHPTKIFCAALCAFVIGSDAAQSAEYYVDPQRGSDDAAGSASAPWRSLQTAIDSGRLRGGDTVYLLDGVHGALSIRGANNTDWVTIAAAPDQTPRLSSVEIESSRFWRLLGLEISPSFGERPDDDVIVDVIGESTDIAIENSIIYSAPDSLNWSLDDWRRQVLNGIFAEGRRITLRGNHLETVYHAIETLADDAIVANNRINNFAGDGIRGLGQRSVYENNRITSCVSIDENHDDGFQSWSLGPDGTPGEGEVVGSVFRNNVIIASLAQDKPFACELQGIGMFDGFFVDWVIENNVIATNHWHGITVMGARNVVIRNNTVAASPGSQAWPWISITYHKDERPPENSVIANNLAPPKARSSDDLFALPKPGVTAEGNVAVDDPDEVFVDAEHFDFRLRQGGPAVDAADPRFAPKTDIGGAPRPKGAGVDAGAYETW